MTNKLTRCPGTIGDHVTVKTKLAYEYLAATRAKMQRPECPQVMTMLITWATLLRRIHRTFAAAIHTTCKGKAVEKCNFVIVISALQES